MTASDPVISIDGLIKYYGSFRALDGLNLTVERGQVHGFLGPNGAGKSTTIRVMLGLLKANGGSVSILGQDPWGDLTELHKRLAYVPGDVSLWPSMSGGEAIDLLGDLRGGLNQNRRKELLERFELDPTKRGRQYSKGNRQKVALVAALASDAELLILDEPTSGLDPLMENVFQEVVSEAKDRGATVLLSSHIMAEVETLADRVSIIKSGTIVQSGTLEEIRGKARTNISARLTAAPSPEALVLFEDLHQEDYHGALRLSGTVEADHAGEAVTALSQYGMSGLTVTPPSLESLFLRLYDTEDGAEDGDGPVGAEQNGTEGGAA